MQSTSMVQKSLTQRGKNFTQRLNTQTTVQNRHGCPNDQSNVEQVICYNIFSLLQSPTK